MVAGTQADKVGCSGDDAVRSCQYSVDRKLRVGSFSSATVDSVVTSSGCTSRVARAEGFAAQV